MAGPTRGIDMARFLRRFGEVVMGAIERACCALAAPLPGVSHLMASTALGPRPRAHDVDAGALGQPAVAMMFWCVPGGRPAAPERCGCCDERELAA